LLGFNVASRCLQCNDGVKTFVIVLLMNLLQRRPKQFRHGDDANIFADSFEASGQKLDLPPHLPFIGRVVAHDRKRQIMVDVDPGRYRLQVAFERINFIFE
jgi:hypothetical protein